MPIEPQEQRMSPQTDRKPLEERLREAASHVEDDVRKVITYINDEVVPDVRRNGSEALRFAAAELRKLAERVDDANRRTPPSPK
jgi:hypothetical protein